MENTNLLPVEIKHVIEESQIKDLSKAEKIAENYAPYMIQVQDQISLVKEL
jgi:hypothetical protein